MAHCVLCDTDGGLLLHRAPNWRLIRATDTPAYPAFYRVVWNAHVAELSDLDAAEQGRKKFPIWNIQHQRIYANPKTGKLYLGEPDSGPAWATWPERLVWVKGAEFDSSTGVLPLALFPQGCLYRQPNLWRFTLYQLLEAGSRRMALLSKGESR